MLLLSGFFWEARYSGIYGSLVASSSELNDSENSEVEAESNEPAPIIVHALDTVDKAKGFQNLFGAFDLIANRNCNSCEEEIRNMRYMQCTPRNDYLEKEILKISLKPGILGDVVRADVRPTSIIKPSCIKMGMNIKFGEGSKNFRECSAAGSTKAVRPCISENYFKLINNSFDLVSACMKDIIAPEESEKSKKLDVRAIYALINIESGFHINAMSGTGAGGIGQFTRAAIRDVNETQLDKIRSALEKHRNAQCRRMAAEILHSNTPMDSGKSSCGRISIASGNPIKNMIYTFAYLNGAKEDMNTTIFENHYYKNKFALSEYDLNKIRRALMVWSHNTGPAGTWTPAKALLNTFYRRQKVTNADQFINQLQQYMQKFPSRANKSNRRRNETSHYFPSITNTLNAIENSIGGGSCVNF
ncbi:MAG: transglycosylase SLT domain-containing protein [Pseudobdellovibrionaceae bacterium]